MNVVANSRKRKHQRSVRGRLDRSDWTAASGEASKYGRLLAGLDVPFGASLWPASQLAAWLQRATGLGSPSCKPR